MGLAVAVVGAGIGGLTAALALARQGHSVTIAERRTGFGEAGAGIQLSPNATRVLWELGLETAVRRAACEPSGVAIRSLRTGAAIGAMRLGPELEQLYGSPYLVIGRQDLHTALLDAVRGRPEIRIKVGRSLTSIDEASGRVRLTLATGSGQAETLEADLAVGADGIGSATRTLLGDGRVPAFSGEVAYRALVPREAAPVSLARPDTGLWLGPGRHVVHYPIAAGRLVNVVAVAPRPAPVEGWSAPVERDAVLAAFADAAPPLAALLAAAPAWSAWSLADLPARTAGRGRVALLGDAAHPVLPYLAQGGALAIEDAAVLASCLARETDPAAALAAYRRTRLPRVCRVQATARRNGRIFHARGPVALARNLVMARLGPDGMADRQAWLYGWRPDAR